MARFASVEDVDLESAQVDLRFEFGPERPAARRLEYRARFTGDTSPEKIHRMMSLVEKGCHTTNTIHAEVPVTAALVVNDEDLGTELGDEDGNASESHSQDLTDWGEYDIEGTVRILETYWREGTSEGFTLHADETKARGGQGKAMSPIRNFMMGTAFGIGNQAVRSAELLEMSLDTLEIDVETAYDARPKMLLGDLYAGALWFSYKLKIQSKDSRATIRRWFEHVHWNARTLDTVRRPVPVVPQVVLNGVDIGFELPDLPSPEPTREMWRGAQLSDGAFAYDSVTQPRSDSGDAM
jgi:uncharacterized OsmC-like protein